MKLLVPCVLVFFFCCGLTMGAKLLKTATNRIPGSYIVVLKSDENADVDKVETRFKTNTKARINGTMKGKGKMKGMIVDIDEGDEDTLQQILDDPGVAYVDEDAVVTPDADNWGLDVIDEDPGNGVYDAPGDGSGKTVYIIDSGTYAGHKNWDKNLKPEELSDFVDGKTKVGDCFGHGTHVAGIVSSPSYGVAKGAQVSGLRIFNCDGYGSWGRVILALSDVINYGIPESIINLSLAGGYSQAATDALADANNAGFLVVAAAGNAAKDGCTVTPANSTDVLAVGAIDSDFSIWMGSNYGPCVDIYAPGAAITSLFIDNPSSTSVKYGTSMASPQVAGMAAVLWGLNPSFTNQQISDLILNNATPDVIQGLDATSHNLLARF